jgi:uncharacterized small protein (DUF1192 family)
MQDIIAALKKEFDRYSAEIETKKQQLGAYQILLYEVQAMEDKIGSLKSAISRLSLYSEIPSVDIPLTGTESAWGDAS